MKKILLLIVIIMQLNIPTGNGGAADYDVLLDNRNEDTFANRIYVVYDSTVDIFWSKEYRLSPSDFPEFVPLIEEFGITEVQNSFYFVNDAFLSRTLTLIFNEKQRTDELLNLLSRESRIQLVEQKPTMKKAVIPNDPSYETFQLELPHIGAEAAWDITTGSGDIDVAIVDDAIQISHPDLNPSIDGTWDESHNDNDPSPPNLLHAHGTHVAGIVSAKANNNQGVASIGFGGLDIIAIKASSGIPDGEGGVLITDGYEGVCRAAKLYAEIINCSWVTSSYTTVGLNAINMIK